jgi:Protein of unknown function (DUF2950)
MKPLRFDIVLTIALSAVLLAPACTKRAEDAAAMSFTTPDAAVAALIAALESQDAKELARLLGPGTEALVSSGDEVADRAAREAFLERYRSEHRLVAGGPDDLVLQVGADQWPLPIPLVRADGHWRFDGAAGAAEILTRRIGANELRTIDVLRSYVGAQQDYASTGHDGAAPGLFARRLRSDPGTQNGLYWEAASGQLPSPAGPLLAAAAAEGYGGAPGKPYHGYLYRVLLSQGPAASGGERQYVLGEELRGGFALLAYPAVYGVSGVMTFMVNHDGVVWQRDLGEETPDAAPALERFDPDERWTPLAPERGE